MAEAQILVARDDRIVQVRLIGRATFKISQDLKDFGTAAVRHGAQGIIVDLSECEGMDSTFLGVLAMIGLEARGQADLVLVNAGDLHRDLLDGIGVSKIWRYAAKQVEETTWESLCEAAAGATDMESIGPTVLAAHKALMDLDPENVPKFKDVVELLTAEIGNAPAGESKSKGE